VRNHPSRRDRKPTRSCRSLARRAHDPMLVERPRDPRRRVRSIHCRTAPTSALAEAVHPHVFARVSVGGHQLVSIRHQTWLRTAAAEPIVHRVVHWERRRL
jgi:hypothetical protein